MIRPAQIADAAALADIYKPYVRDTTITFEEEVVSAEEMASRLRQVTATHPWLVWDKEGVILGYAYASTWRTRHAYRFTAETTVYLAQGHHGQGLGTRLYEELLLDLRSRGFHSALGCLSLPNDPSVRLHEKLGFRKVGHVREAGWKFGAWVDVGFWERLLS